CLFVAGKLYVRDAWLDLASDTFGKISRAQTPHGALLTTTPADNPDSHAYHELVLLHALASYAVGAEDRTIAASVARATEFHLQHTQPEHATWKPWAVFAFIWDEQSRPLADTILHAAKIQQLDSNDGISLMLLADALYCLRLFPI
ncbi:MAG: hypothetical protein ACREJC_02205, partial [Tepidisphaeraceae bacterium]